MLADCRRARPDPRSRVRRPHRSAGLRRRGSRTSSRPAKAPTSPGLPRLLRRHRRVTPRSTVASMTPRRSSTRRGRPGKAKGAVLTHGNLTWVALNCLVDYDVVSTDVALMISPLFHVASLGMGALPVILKGAHDRAREGLRARAARSQLIERARRHDAERGADDVSAARRSPGLGGDRPVAPSRSSPAADRPCRPAS